MIPVLVLGPQGRRLLLVEGFALHLRWRTNRACNGDPPACLLAFRCDSRRSIRAPCFQPTYRYHVL